MKGGWNPRCTAVPWCTRLSDGTPNLPMNAVNLSARSVRDTIFGNHRRPSRLKGVATVSEAVLLLALIHLLVPLLATQGTGVRETQVV